MARRLPKKTTRPPTSEKVTPVGDVLPLAELMAMADVTDDDVKRAGRTWRRMAPKKAKRLLDATPVKRKRKNG
jgi:hypothetical protein